MPRHPAVDLPFASRLNAHAEAIAMRHLAWPMSFGLLLDENSQQRHMMNAYADLGGRFFPSATANELALGIDQMSWLFIFDDMFDGPLGVHQQEANALVNYLVGVVGQGSHVPYDERYPIVAAFRDLWLRSCLGASSEWRCRSAHSWLMYLSGHLAETAHRLYPIPLTFDDHLSLRRKTSGVFPILDMGERLLHLRLPARVYHHRLMEEIREIAADIVVFDNEIFSFEKEMVAGDRNLITTLQHDKGCGIEEAIMTINRRINLRIEQLLILKEETFDFLARSYLPSEEIEHIRMYISDCVEPVMKGARDWQMHSHRYATSL